MSFVHPVGAPIVKYGQAADDTTVNEVMTVFMYKRITLLCLFLSWLTTSGCLAAAPILAGAGASSLALGNLFAMNSATTDSRSDTDSKPRAKTRVGKQTKQTTAAAAGTTIVLTTDVPLTTGSEREVND